MMHLIQIRTLIIIFKALESNICSLTGSNGSENSLSLISSLLIPTFSNVSSSLQWQLELVGQLLKAQSLAVLYIDVTYTLTKYLVVPHVMYMLSFHSATGRALHTLNSKEPFFIATHPLLIFFWYLLLQNHNWNKIQVPSLVIVVFKSPKVPSMPKKRVYIN